MSALTICTDFKSALAYLANEPTWALLNELGVNAHWLPFVAPPMTQPTPPPPGSDRGTWHRYQRAAYHARDLHRYALARGLAIDDPYRNPDVTLASIALLCVADESRAVQERFMTRVFADYWSGTLDLEDAGQLRGVLVDTDADGAAFDARLAGSGYTELAAVQTRLAGMGVFSAPAYIVDDEIFYGRAHLPMIRWLLTGKEGPGPL